MSAGPAGTLRDLGAVAGPWLLSVLISRQTLFKNGDRPARGSSAERGSEAGAAFPPSSLRRLEAKVLGITDRSRREISAASADSVLI